MPESTFKRLGKDQKRAVVYLTELIRLLRNLKINKKKNKFSQRLMINAKYYLRIKSFSHNIKIINNLIHTRTHVLGLPLESALSEDKIKICLGHISRFRQMIKNKSISFVPLNKLLDILSPLEDELLRLQGFREDRRKFSQLAGASVFSALTFGFWSKLFGKSQEKKILIMVSLNKGMNGLFLKFQKEIADTFKKYTRKNIKMVIKSSLKSFIFVNFGEKVSYYFKKRLKKFYPTPHSYIDPRQDLKEIIKANISKVIYIVYAHDLLKEVFNIKIPSGLSLHVIEIKNKEGETFGQTIFKKHHVCEDISQLDKVLKKVLKII